MSDRDSSSSRLEPLPNVQDIDAVLAFLRTQRSLSAINRVGGDEEAAYGEVRSAISKWQAASRQNLRALEGARSYAGFRSLFAQDGSPITGRNYPLEGAEAEFARLYCDTLGRQGGLFRRLGSLEEALEYYRLGSLIEARSADLAFENSYNTMNAVSIMIELGIRSAFPLGRASLADVRPEILKARDMVKAQIIEGKRGNDAWAMADLAMATMLSNDVQSARVDVPIYYRRYASRADIDDIQTTLRILRRLLEKLLEINDPTARLVEAGVAELMTAAAEVGKVVE